MELGKSCAARALAAVAVALITIGTVGLSAVPAGSAPPGGGGSISGRVVAPGLVPLQGICVGVPGGASTVTDSSGVYSLTGLAAGSYVVQYSDCNASPAYVTQWYLGRTDQGSADPVNVVDLVDTPLSDVSMTAGVSVTGTITDSGGNPIPNVNVNVNSNGSGPSGYAQTAPDGTYATAPIAPGSYKVQFSPTDPTFAAEYWNNQVTWNTADSLVLDTAAGPVHGGVDAQLATAATIQGTVTDAGGTPLSSVCVDANISNGNGNGWSGINGTQTAGDGTYTLGGLPPTDVRIHFRDCSSGPHIDQWYSGQADFNSSTPLVLTAGAVQTGVDAHLATGIEVSGTVTDSGGNPIPNVSVNVNPTGSGSSAWAQTDPSGHYTTNALPPGTYEVQFQGTPSFAGQYWSGKLTRIDSDTLTLSSGDGPVHGGIDATLAVGASVAGRVTGPTGLPVGNICVSAAVDSSDGGVEGIAGTSTASDGTYTITGLPATNVKVVFRDCNAVGPYVQEWWKNQATSSTANAIVLAPGDARTGVNAQLAAAGSITGTVTDRGGHPLQGICAQATTGTFVGGLSTTDSSGRYTIVLAKPGNYKVQFVDCSGSPTYAGQWWNGRSTPATARPRARRDRRDGVGHRRIARARRCGFHLGHCRQRARCRDDERLCHRVPPEPVRALRCRAARRFVHDPERAVGHVRARVPRVHGWQPPAARARSHRRGRELPRGLVAQRPLEHHR